MSAGIAIETATKASRAAAAVGLVLVVAVASMPWWADSGTLRTGMEFLYYLALAQIWNLMAGYGGLVSFGQQAFLDTPDPVLHVKNFGVDGSRRF